MWNLNFNLVKMNKQIRLLYKQNYVDVVTWEHTHNYFKKKQEFQ